MTIDSKRAEDDLAFMRAIVEDHGTGDGSFGILYLAAGILYGLQCLLNAALLGADFPVSTLVWLAVGWLPTVLFMIVIFYNAWKHRAQPIGTGTTKRALGAAFAGAGIANVVLALVFGWVAYQKRDWSIWLLYPVIVCALQGAIWFAVSLLRRRFWQGLTSIGWFVSALALGFLLNQTQAYLLALGIALFVCMTLPGFVMLRSSAQNRAKT